MPAILGTLLGAGLLVVAVVALVRHDRDKDRFKGRRNPW